MNAYTETVTTVDLDYGERGPIVTCDLHEPTRRYEIVRVSRAVSAEDGSVTVVVRGVPLRRDGKRMKSTAYSAPIYGVEVVAAAMAMLAAAVGEPTNG